MVLSASAYVPVKTTGARIVTKLASDETGSVIQEIPEVPAPVKKVALAAKWLPIGGLKAPMALDGTLAGEKLSYFKIYLYFDDLRIGVFCR